MFLVEPADGASFGHAVAGDHAGDGAACLGEGLVGGEFLALADAVVHSEDDLAVRGGVADVVGVDGFDLVGWVVGVGFADEGFDALVPVGLGEVLVVLYHFVEVGLLGHTPGAEAAVVGGPGCGLAYGEELLARFVEEDHTKFPHICISLPFTSPEFLQLFPKVG